MLATGGTKRSGNQNVAVGTGPSCGLCHSSSSRGREYVLIRASTYSAARDFPEQPKNRGCMSDGNEERHESRIRIEQELREDLEDRIPFDDADEGEPERPDS